MSSDYRPPQNLEMEQAVLGSMLIEKLAIDRATSILTAECFYLDVHRIIYEAMISLHDAGTPVDLMTLSERLSARSELEALGGFLYLQNLMDAPSSAANVEYYAGIVHDKFLLRRLQEAATQIDSRVRHSEDTPPAEIIEDVERLISDIALSRTTTTLIPLEPIIEARLSEFHKRIEHKGRTGFLTPFDDYNYMSAGLHPGDLTIIAARPSMGKTSAIVQMALHHARTCGPVAFFSLEMSHEQIGDRIMFSEARVDSNQARTGFVQQEQVARVNAMAAELKTLPLFIDDTPTASIQELRSKARRKHAEQAISLVCVDYLQLIGGSARRSGSRTEEIGEVARGLKALARDLKIPVIALAQLSRAVEQRPDKRPILSDLRESGDIEANADVVVFIYRGSYYGKRDDSTEHASDIDVAEFIFAKQRNGPTGKIELGWHGPWTRFENLAVGRDDGQDVAPTTWTGDNVREPVESEEVEPDPFDETNPENPFFKGME